MKRQVFYWHEVQLLFPFLFFLEMLQFLHNCIIFGAGELKNHSKETRLAITSWAGWSVQTALLTISQKMQFNSRKTSQLMQPHGNLLYGSDNLFEMWSNRWELHLSHLPLQICEEKKQNSPLFTRTWSGQFFALNCCTNCRIDFMEAKSQYKNSTGREEETKTELSQLQWHKNT